MDSFKYVSKVTLDTLTKKSLKHSGISLEPTKVWSLSVNISGTEWLFFRGNYRIK